MRALFFLATFFLSWFSYGQIPPGVKIEYIQTKGKGCIPGSVHASISHDFQTFSVLMDNYMAETGLATNLEKRDCTIEVGVVVPAGYSFTIETADYRGFVHGESGTQLSHQVIYSFDGSRPPNENPGFGTSPGKYNFERKVFYGPITEEYFIRNRINPAARLWSPCSPSGGRIQPLYLQTMLIAQAQRRGSESMITLDTVDGAIQQQFTWSWKQCAQYGPQPPPPPGGVPPRRPNPPRFPGR